ELGRLVAVPADIHDHEIAVLALPRLPRSVSETLGGVEFLDSPTMDLIRGGKLQRGSDGTRQTKAANEARLLIVYAPIRCWKTQQFALDSVSRKSRQQTRAAGPRACLAPPLGETCLVSQSAIAPATYRMFISCGARQLWQTSHGRSTTIVGEGRTKTGG